MGRHAAAVERDRLAVTLPSAADLPPSSMRPRVHRRIRSPAALAGIAGSGRRSGPTTPLLGWKLDGSGSLAGDAPPASKQRKGRGNAAAAAAAARSAVSARRLAAGIWHLQVPELRDGRRSGERPFEEFIPGHLQHLHAHLPCKINGEFSSPITADYPRNSTSHKIETPVALPHSALERATKWDPGCSNASEKAHRFHNHLKLLEDQHVTAVSVVSALQKELERAHRRISDLETERSCAKKKLDQLLRKISEDKASWRSREHEKIRAIIDDMKADLSRERKNRQRIEVVNSKLFDELAEVKLSTKRFFQDYEKERRARELMEEVCNELAKEIGEDKAEVEALKAESLKIQEEVEEERKMLQMAEVWREERVQMKLVDAKVMLEEKYSQIRILQFHLEEILRDPTNHNLDAAKIREAESLMEVVSSVVAQEVKFSYQPPPASDDFLSVFEELRPREASGDGDLENCYEYSPASRASKIHAVSPDTDGFLEKSTRKYNNGPVHQNGDAEDDSGWETVSEIEEQESSNSPCGSDPSVANGVYEENNVSVSGTDWEERGIHGISNGDLGEVCSATTRQSRNKAASIVRIWRSSLSNNGENPRKSSVDVINNNGRVSNGRMSNALDVRSGGGEMDLSPQSLDKWSSPDSVNPHITRGMKGCIDWPRGGGMQKHSLKAKLLEARIDSRKVQLKQVLKQRS